MLKQLVVFTVTASACLAAYATVPAAYQGVWTLDSDASMQAIEAARASLTPAQKDRLVRGVTVDMKDLALEIGDHSLTYKIPGQTMEVPLVLDEDKGDRAIFSSPKAGTVTMQIGPDGLLNHHSSKDDDFDLIYFRREGSAASQADTSSPNPSVAYLDGLKTCTPGAFHLTYPGLGTFDNTIVGRNGDRCQVRVEHPQITLLCNYSDATIALLTSEAKYEEARNGVLSGSTDSPESQRAAEECTPD